jgi:hypothetical protein
MSPTAFYVACVAWCLVCWAALIWFVATALEVLS